MARVRAFLADVLEGCPAAADVILLADELVSNSVLHTDSGKPGGEFSVRAEICDGRSVRVEVADAGGPWTRSCSDGRPDGDICPDGRGLLIVEALARAWGVSGDDTGRTAWFETGWTAG